MPITQRPGPIGGSRGPDSYSLDSMKQGRNQYVEGLLDNLVPPGEDTLTACGMRRDGSFILDGIGPRDGNDGSTRGLEDQHALGGMELAGNSGSNGMGGRQKPSDDFFSSGGWFGASEPQRPTTRRHEPPSE